MGSSVLDASAFYAGVPFGSRETFYTTGAVYDEIRHIKRSHDALGMLLETGRLVVRDPDAGSVRDATGIARRTGDYGSLSSQDISVIALSMEMNGRIISDDYAVANVAGSAGISVTPVMTRGIRDVGRWIHYCPGCGTRHADGGRCPACDTPLRRRLLK